MYANTIGATDQRLSPYHRCVLGGNRWLFYSLNVLLSVTSIALGASVKNTNHTVMVGVKCISIY